MNKCKLGGIIAFFLMLFSSAIAVAQLHVNGGSPYLMNQAKDVSTDFGDFTNIFFFALPKEAARFTAVVVFPTPPF